MFTEGCMVLIEGEYTIEETVRVLAMGHPPSEKRDIARWIFISLLCEIGLIQDHYMATSISWELEQSRSKKRFVIQIQLVTKYRVDE